MALSRTLSMCERLVIDETKRGCIRVVGKAGKNLRKTNNYLRHRGLPLL